MLVQLTTKLSVGGSSPLSEVTQPVTMAGANAVQYAVTPFYTNSSGLSYQLQESQDLENWTDLGSSQSGVNYPKLFPTETNVTTPYVRLKASVIASGKMVLAITINTSHQSP